jgi:hypothetical protein
LVVIEPTRNGLNFGPGLSEKMRFGCGRTAFEAGHCNPPLQNRGFDAQMFDNLIECESTHGAFFIKGVVFDYK